jgi:RNA polymerase sigma-70 factor (ECF subfamily)
MSTTQKQRKPQEIASSLRDLHESHYRRLVNSMTSIVRDRDAAEDISAAAFGKALAKRDEFRGESSLYTWVFAIARNEARQQQLRKRAVSLDALEFTPSALVVADRLGEASERSEHLQRLQKALGSLPAIYRQPLVDHFVRGYTAKRIARRDQIPVGTVLSRIFAAKRLLRAAWEA